MLKLDELAGPCVCALPRGNLPGNNQLEQRAADYLLCLATITVPNSPSAVKAAPAMKVA